MGLLIGTVDGVYEPNGSAVLAGDRINHIARGEDGWWAVDDAGTVWHEAERVVSAPPGVGFNCVRPGPDEVWLGADRARLFLLRNGDLVEDDFFADAPGRDKWHTPWGGPPDVRSMDFGPDGVLYINVHVGGILRYDNTGLAPTVDIDSDVHQVVAHPELKAVVLAATALGLAVSTNGHDFEFRTDGLAARYCRAVAVHGDTVLVAASRGPRGGDAHLYRGDVIEGPLERCRRGLPESFEGNLDTHCVVTGRDTIYAGNGATVWRSEDDGMTWSVAAENLPTITCLA